MVVYLIICLLTGMSYVGQTVEPLSTRWARHTYSARNGSNYYLHNAIRKYGSENFSIEPLVIVGSKSEMDYYEKALIKSLNTFAPSGYNLTSGGEGMSGYKHTPETIAKIRAAQTPEMRLRISAALTGRKPTPEALLNMRANKKPLVFSDDYRAKLSAAGKGNQRTLGLKHTPETKANISAAKMGYKHTSEARAKMMGNKNNILGNNQFTKVAI